VPNFVDMLIYLFVALIVAGTAFWLVNKFCPNEIKPYVIGVLVLVAVIFVCYFLLGMTHGGMGYGLERRIMELLV
jgi:hypothetical protein